MKSSRRATLRMLSVLTGGAMLGCGSSGKARGVSNPEDPDAGEQNDSTLCRATRADAKGPFFEAGAPMRMRIAEAGESGTRLYLQGTVLGPDCQTPIARALLDVWQADSEGRYFGAVENDYRLRGQVLSDSEGKWMIETIMPGHYENGEGAWRPAHLHFTVSAPGHKPVTTQLYFAGDPYLAPNDGCPTACDSGDPKRVITLSSMEGARFGTWQVVLDKA